MKDTSMKKSKELFEKAKKVIPGGVQNARRPSCFTNSYPIFNDKAKGSHLWDVDGNEYIDWLLSYGPIVLGHCDEKVDDAVISVIKNGFLFNLSAPIQIELAEKLIQHVPCAEMCVTVMTGSEATATAVRIARTYTGKDIIARWGYHGWLDWCVDNKTGVPGGVTNDTKSFKYNDLNSLEEVLIKNKGKVAAIIMMPFEVVMPEKGFLEGVRKLADNHKAVLIFDEIRSWPRMGLGGAQKYFGVTPDITALSKGLGNGYPISVVVGKADIMQATEKTVISATYFPSKMGMVAALETIRQLENEKLIEHFKNIGERLSNGLRKIIENKKIKASVMGAPQLPFLIFGDEEVNIKALSGQSMVAAVNTSSSGKVDKEIEKANKLTDLFYSETIKRGVFFHPKHHWFTCTSHTFEDVDNTLKICDESLNVAVKNL